MKMLQIGSTGIYVELLQSTLKKIGYYISNIDGIFGNKTMFAVKNFQEQFGIDNDGIVGNITWNKLFPYINGFTTYIVKLNDTLSSIATYFDTSINRILTANPNLSSNSILNIGDEIIVPFRQYCSNRY